MPVIRSLPVAFQRINEGGTATKYGSASVTQIGTGDGSKTFAQRTLLRSQVIDVPDGHEVTSAILRVYASNASGAGSKDITAFGIADDDASSWVPSEATWASKDFGVAWGVAGGNPGATSDVTAGVELATGFIELDMTNLVALALTKSPNQINAVLKMAEIDDSKLLTLVSHNGADPEQQPRLTLVMNPIAVERRGGDQPFVPRVGGWMKGASED